MSDWKPGLYNSVSPYLVVPSAIETTEFLKKTFGAEELRRQLRRNGSINHIEMRVEDTVVMIGDPGENWPAYTAHLHIYVQDAGAVFGRAIKAGGTTVIEPFLNEDNTEVRGSFKDPGGNTWWIATILNSAH